MERSNEGTLPPVNPAPAWARLVDAMWLPSELRAIGSHMRGLTWQPLVWVAGFAFDLLALTFVWTDASWAWVLGVRLAGAPLQPLVVLLARRPGVDERVVALVSWSYTVAIAALLALQSLSFGGLESPWVLGLLGFTFGGSLVAEVRTSRVALTVGAWFVAWVAVLALGARSVPAIAAQFATARSIVYFMGHWSLVVAVAAGAVHFGRRIAALLRELHVARRLAGYRLQARIGVGGMNEVWLAWDEGAKRDVALKILHHDPSPETARRFRREAQALRALDDEHTVRILDVGASDDGVMFIAMEHLEGLDLGRLVAAEGPLTPARSVALLRQACASLREAHARGIVHRDVKPSNLFLTRARSGGDLLKVLDFGIAQQLTEAEAPITEQGEAVGTPHFMAPEVLLGIAADARVDVYGLGATLYFLITGMRPFEGLTGAALAVAVSSAPLVPPSARSPRAVPAALDAVVARALARDLGERYASVEQLDDALAALQGSLDADAAASPHATPGALSATPRSVSRDAPTQPVDR
jgi:serine/threonine-protein kinase